MDFTEEDFDIKDTTQNMTINYTPRKSEFGSAIPTFKHSDDVDSAKDEDAIQPAEAVTELLPNSIETEEFSSRLRKQNSDVGRRSAASVMLEEEDEEEFDIPTFQPIPSVIGSDQEASKRILSTAAYGALSPEITSWCTQPEFDSENLPTAFYSVPLNMVWGPVRFFIEKRRNSIATKIAGAYNFHYGDYRVTKGKLLLAAKKPKSLGSTAYVLSSIGDDPESKDMTEIAKLEGNSKKTEYSLFDHGNDVLVNSKSVSPRFLAAVEFSREENRPEMEIATPLGLDESSDTSSLVGRLHTNAPDIQRFQCITEEMSCGDRPPEKLHHNETKSSSRNFQIVLSKPPGIGQNEEARNLSRSDILLQMGKVL